MRKIIAITFVTFDSVMQAQGGPKEDTSGDFRYGGWTVPYSREEEKTALLHAFCPI
jgi:hypothetical protein